MEHRRGSTFWLLWGLFACLLFSSLFQYDDWAIRSVAKQPKVCTNLAALAHVSSGSTPWRELERREHYLENMKNLQNGWQSAGVVDLANFSPAVTCSLEPVSTETVLLSLHRTESLKLSRPLGIVQNQKHRLPSEPRSKKSRRVADPEQIVFKNQKFPYAKRRMDNDTSVFETVLPTNPIAPGIQSQAEILEGLVSADKWDTVVETSLTESTAISQACWPRPVTLMPLLKSLGKNTGLRSWSERVVYQLENLLSKTSFDDQQLILLFDGLSELARAGRAELKLLSDSHHRTMYARAVYGVEKRIGLWRLLYRVALVTGNEEIEKRDLVELDKKHAAVQKMLGMTAKGKAWQRFLGLEELTATEGLPRRNLADQILNRMSGPQVTPLQQKFLERRVIQDLAGALYRVKCRSIDFFELLERLEKYEAMDRTADGECIAQRIQWLLQSDDPLLYQLGSHLDRHWRNANVRVSISSELMGRFLPNADTVRDRVRNRFGDAVIRGTSWTTTQMSWKLIPDQQKIRVELVAQGHVRSETVANQGGARTQNRGQVRFEALKPVWFDEQGLHVNDAIASARSSVRIHGIETSYDRIPLFGPFARTLGQNRAEQQKGHARQVMEQHVVQAAKHRLDTVVDRQLTPLVDFYKNNVHSPLVHLDLEPVPVTLQTTDRRIMARYRLADGQQLGAWSPRPLAFSDTLLSIQMHQSSINNLVEKLELNGKRFELERFYKTIPQRLGFETIRLPDDLPQNVKLRFAVDEPVRFQFKSGRVCITIRLASLTKGRRYRWRNLTIDANYIPDSSTVNAKLVREESIQLTGKNLRLSDQVTLRGIFSNVLSRKRTFSILQEKLANHRHIRDLAIHEFVVEDGWIGVAWGVPRLADGGKRLSAR